MKQLTLKIPEKKYQFIMELLKSFDYIKIETEEFSIPEEHKNIVRKRIEKSKADPSRWLDWEKVKSEIRL
jgi:hypothetical protein